MFNIRFAGVVDHRGGAGGTLFRRILARFRDAHGDAVAVASAGRPDAPEAAVVLARRAYATALSVSPDGSFTAIDGEAFSPSSATLDETCARLHLRADPAADIVSAGLAGNLAAYRAGTRLFVAARDPAGLSPLFAAEHAGALAFASDLDTLRMAGLGGGLDLAALDLLFGIGFAPAPYTPFVSIRRVPAGHCVTVRPAAPLATVRYYVRPRERPLVRNKVEIVARDLYRAVEMRADAGATTGVLLSGGVDSALILGTVRDVGAAAEAFTFSYGDYRGPFNEESAAADIARYFRVPHHVLRAGPRDVADALPTLVAAFGEPFTFGLHSLKAAALRGTGIEVFLNGSGADGFSIDRSARAAMSYASLPRLLRRAAEASEPLLETAFPDLHRKAAAVLWADRHRLSTAFFPPHASDESRRALFADKAAYDARARETLGFFRRSEAAYASYGPVAAWRYAVQDSFAADCMSTWNAVWGRWANVGMRAPFFDLKFQNLMDRASPEGRGKDILRQIAGSMMPKRFAGARKVPQTIPIGGWLRAGQLREMLEDTLAAPDPDGIFDMRAARALADRHVRGARDHTWSLWSLIVFAAWRRSLSTPALAPVRDQVVSQTATAIQAPLPAMARRTS